MPSNKLNITIQLQALDKLTKPLKNMTSNADKLRKIVDKNKQALDNLKSIQGTINQVDKFNQVIKSGGKELIAQNQKVKQLTEQVNNATNPTKRLARQLEVATEKLGRMTDLSPKNYVLLVEL